MHANYNEHFSLKTKRGKHEQQTNSLIMIQKQPICIFAETLFKEISEYVIITLRYDV